MRGREDEEEPGMEGEVGILRYKTDTGETIISGIIEAIRSMGELGATIEDLAKILHLERHTLSKHLNRLRADGLLSYKQIGRAKVWFVNRGPLQHIFRLPDDEKTYTERVFSRILSDIPEGILVLDVDYNILFMNHYLIARYGDCVGQKYHHAFFLKSRVSESECKISEIIEGRSEEVTSQTRDKMGRILSIKARKTENPDASFSVIAIIKDISEEVRREERIKQLSELHRLIGESGNRAYTVDQLCLSILENLRLMIGYDMGDIVIYNSAEHTLSDLAQLGYCNEKNAGTNPSSALEDWRVSMATVAINRKAPVFFNFQRIKQEGKTEENGLDRSTCEIAERYDLHEVYAIPLKSKGELHGALLILAKSGTLSEDDRSLIKGVSEAIAGGIAKLKTEEDLRLRASAIELSFNAVLMANLKGIVTYVNPAFLRLWGYEREGDILAHPWTALAKLGSTVLGSLCAQGYWEGTFVGMRKDGTEFEARLSASLIVGKGGPLQFIAVVEPCKGEDGTKHDQRS